MRIRPRPYNQKVRMTASDIEAIVQGRHGDAFSILGPHVIRPKRGAPRWEVRAFVPHAAAVSVVMNGQGTPMGRRHTDGLFVTTLDGQAVGMTAAHRSAL